MQSYQYLDSFQGLHVADYPCDDPKDAHFCTTAGDLGARWSREEAAIAGAVLSKVVDA